MGVQEVLASGRCPRNLITIIIFSKKPNNHNNLLPLLGCAIMNRRSFGGRKIFNYEVLIPFVINRGSFNI